ncbi:MAG: hypothetical protein KA713_01255 [Chryseotalea sp. WA131a]|jgi:hypothetical protein|nr:MAG: hypothetical protein KA713_01255 [Chryseotalea sp. WA131a]
MKNKTMITDSPSHCANMVLWVSAALHKIKHGWLGVGQRGGKRGHAIGADSKPEKQWKKVYEFVNKDDYDNEFGWVVEYGFYSIEEYFFLKGRTIQFELDSFLGQGNQAASQNFSEKSFL